MPETVISRTQRFNFLPISQQAIASHLKQIARSEGIKLDDAAVELISRHSGGSMRDAISFLDQIATSKPGDIINKEDVVNTLGLADPDAVSQLRQGMIKGDYQAVFQLLEELRRRNANPKLIVKQLSELIRNDKEITKGELRLIEDMLAVYASPEPRLLFETILLRYTLENARPSQTREPVTAKSSPDSAKGQVSSRPATPAVKEPDFNWQKILSLIKERNNSLYAILRLAEVALEEKTLNLSFPFAFHKKRMEEDANKRLLAECLAEVYAPLEIKVLLGDRPSGENVDTADNATKVMNLMGGGSIINYQDE